MNNIHVKVTLCRACVCVIRSVLTWARMQDLNVLNRDLKRVIIVDTNPDHYMLNAENGLCIPEWDGNPEDDTLVELVKFFTSVCFGFVNGRHAESWGVECMCNVQL